MSDDLQFGFKKGIGCNNAIFSLCTAIEYFRECGSTVYTSAFDINKAFIVSTTISFTFRFIKQAFQFGSLHYLLTVN